MLDSRVWSDERRLAPSGCKGLGELSLTTTFWAVTEPLTVRFPLSSKAKKLPGSDQVLSININIVATPDPGVQISRALPIVRPGRVALAALPGSALLVVSRSPI